MARSEHTGTGGRRYFELLANYQKCERCPCEEVHGGNGYLRLLEFRPDASIGVTTYSPFLDRWLEDPDNAFELR